MTRQIKDCAVTRTAADILDTDYETGQAAAGGAGSSFRLSVLERLKHSSKRLGIINVRDYGALGGTAATDTSGAQAAFAALPSYGGIIVIPPSASNYLLTANVFASISSRMSVEVWLFGQLETDVTQIIPRDVVVRGFGRGSTTPSSAARFGGGFLASATFSTGGDPVVWLGETGVSSHGTRLENIFIDGRGRAAWGVKTDSAQELSGMSKVFITNVDNGVLATTSAASATNYLFEDLEIYLKAGSTGYGVDILSDRISPCTVRRVTVNHLSGSAAGTGYRFRGVNIIGRELFAETMTTGLQIGDGSVSCYGIRVDGIAGITGTDVVRVSTGDMRDLNISTIAGSAVTNLMVDQKYGVTLDVATFGNACARYEFEHSTLRTSAHDRSTTWTAPAGATADLAIGGASYLRVTPDGGGTSSITGIAGGYMSRELLITNVGGAVNLVLTHASGTAANQIHSSTGADLTLTGNQAAKLIYGVSNNGATGGWFATKLP